MTAENSTFESFLSQLASRLRHDLKGGLLTLKMGLESLSEEEPLKPLLLEKSQELVDLSDKLALLLRMGTLQRQPLPPLPLFSQAAAQAEQQYPDLRVGLESEGELRLWQVDPDALTYAFLELCHNASLAGATKVSVCLRQQGSQGVVELHDDGAGFTEPASSLLPLGVSRWGRSGLGLSVVSGCAIGHFGRFELESSGSGATARLILGGSTSP